MRVEPLGKSVGRREVGFRKRGKKDSTKLLVSTYRGRKGEGRRKLSWGGEKGKEGKKRRELKKGGGSASLRVGFEGKKACFHFRGETVGN